MNKITVAVCDEQETYCDRFAAYLIGHRAGEMEVCTYADAEVFLEDLKERKIDLAVLGSGFETAVDIAAEKGIPVLYMREEAPMAVAEETSWQKQDVLVREVFRYQPMECILHEMQILSGEKGEKRGSRQALMSRMEVIGIYSPEQHEMQMAFAVTYSRLLAENRRVLYLNLMEHSGFSRVFGVDGETDMGDVILRVRSGKECAKILSRSIYQMDGLSYILPFNNPENLHELTVEDLSAFLKILEEETSFETVVLDFGQGIAQFDQMLGRCDSIYCPMRHGYYYECRRDSFMDYLEHSENEVISERIHMVELPFLAKHIRGDTDVLRQLLWSEFGDHVRNCLAGI